MESLSQLVKSTLPNYLSNLPIPDSVGGWFKLSCKFMRWASDWSRLEFDLTQKGAPHEPNIHDNDTASSFPTLRHYLSSDVA